MKTLILALALTSALTAAPAAAQQVSGQGQYGDVTTVAGGTQIASDPFAGPGYGGIYFTLTNFTVGDLTQLSATYTLDSGALAGGAPRFTLFDSSDRPAYIYFTSPTSTNLTASTIVECNGFGGCAYNYPGITFANFVTQVGASTGLSAIFLDVDAGYSSRQQITVSNFSVNGTVFGAVPEPSTWAMMLLGFGAIGVAMRRSRRRHGALVQVA